MTDAFLQDVVAPAELAAATQQAIAAITADWAAVTSDLGRLQQLQRWCASLNLP